MSVIGFTISAHCPSIERYEVEMRRLMMNKRLSTYNAVETAIDQTKKSATASWISLMKPVAKEATRRPVGRPSLPPMPCGWCGEPHTVTKLRSHATVCPERPWKAHDPTANPCKCVVCRKQRSKT